MWEPLKSNYNKFYGKRIIIEKDCDNNSIQGILTKIYKSQDNEWGVKLNMIATNHLNKLPYTYSSTICGNLIKNIKVFYPVNKNLIKNICTNKTNSDISQVILEFDDDYINI